MEGRLPLAPGDTPRCNLKGHGLFKGAVGRTEAGEMTVREAKDTLFAEVDQADWITDR